MALLNQKQENLASSLGLQIDNYIFNPREQSDLQPALDGFSSHADQLEKVWGDIRVQEV